MRKALLPSLILFIFLVGIGSCKGKKTATVEIIPGLKKGNLVSCGPPEKEFGTVGFETSCKGKIKEDFNLGVALLHSFEYDEAEKVFAKIIDEEPGCPMAYWGVAMSNYHPLWSPPTREELEKGAKAIAIAQSLPEKSKTETAYINAVAAFYKDWDKTDHRSRSMQYKNAMEKLYADYPANKEAAIFYALALDATADPADKTFVNQKKAGAILNTLYPEGPNHPGVVHYIIHTYDYPELAELALPAARKYASIAPSSAHAQHMPSHIFTRLGLWDECIQSNKIAGESAKCYAETAGIKGHWDEEMHTLDYLMYGYLQKGDDAAAQKVLTYLNGIEVVEPVNFKVLYSFAAVPARYALEKRLWKEAAALPFYPANYPWDKYPWQKAIIHFARLMGATRSGDQTGAKEELQKIQAAYDTLVAQKDDYKATQVLIQLKTGNAWIQLGEGKNKEALQLMQEAAALEDKTEKHPVTPGEVLPARELLGDMLLQLHKPAEALVAYEDNLKKRPNRLNSLYGAAQASEQLHNTAKATAYYNQLLTVANTAASGRTELEKARLFLKKDKS